MQKFVARQNIARFRQMLEAETDEHRRETLRHMIAEEEAKLSADARAEAMDPDQADAAE